MSVSLTLVSAMADLGGRLVEALLGGGFMGCLVTSLPGILSCVAAWLGGGASFPSWTYKADAIRVAPGRRHHFTSYAPASP